MPSKVLPLLTKKLQLCRKNGLIGVVGLFRRRKNLNVTTTFDIADSNFVCNHGVLISFMDILHLWKLIYRFVVASRRISLKSTPILAHGGEFQMRDCWGSVLHYSIILWLWRSIIRSISIDLDLRAHCRFIYRVLLRCVARLLEAFCISWYLKLLFDWENPFFTPVYFNLILCFDFSESKIILLGLGSFLRNVILPKWKMMLVFLFLLQIWVVLCAESE